MGPDRCEHATKRRFVLIGVEPEILWRDPRRCRYGRRFQRKQAGSRKRQLTKMDNVPIAGIPILRRVLAHWRNQNPIIQSETAEAERLEQGRAQVVPQEGWRRDRQGWASPHERAPAHILECSAARESILTTREITLRRRHSPRALLN